MIVVGQVSNIEEAKEIELISQIFIVANRARLLALKARDAKICPKKLKNNQKQPPNSNAKRRVAIVFKQ
jgi:hypothetical protein